MDILELFKKKGMPVEKKANEIMHPSNTGYGAEFIPDEVFSSEIFNIIPQRATLLNLLPGNHGRNLPKKYTAGAIGLSVGDLEFEGKTNWTTGTGSETENDHSQQKAATKQVSIEQASFICEVDIADDQLLYNAVNTEEYVKQRIADGMIYTVESLILNGDAETGATGNVNLDDAAPNAKKHYLKLDHGVRERAINNSYTLDGSTLAAADYADLLAKMGEYATNPQDCLFIQPNVVTLKSLQLDEFETVQNSGDRAAIQRGLRPTPYGVEMLTHRAVKKTEADGKISTTAGNNTKGQILALYKAAVQYGFGQDFKLEVVRVAGYGWRLVATFDFGFYIIDAEASLDNPTVAAAINITL